MIDKKLNRFEVIARDILDPHGIEAAWGPESISTRFAKALQEQHALALTEASEIVRDEGEEYSRCHNGEAYSFSRHAALVLSGAAMKTRQQ